MTAVKPEAIGAGAMGVGVAGALDVARGLARAGCVLFRAPGMRLPARWQESRPGPDSLRAVEDWRPGDGLALVGGTVFDVLDVDPRNGGTASEASLREAGLWPRAYGVAGTPSGGTHHLIRALGIGKCVAASGIDLQGGRPDGTGRGFVWLAPTVRASKLDGVPHAYEWVIRPGIGGAGSVADLDGDDTGEGLSGLLSGRRESSGRVPDDAGTTPVRDRTIGGSFAGPGTGVNGAGGVNGHDHRFTRAQAGAYVKPWLEELRTARDGTINDTLNKAAIAIGHFVPTVLDRGTAEVMLKDALKETVYDGRTWKAEDTIRSGLDAAVREPGGWRAVLVEESVTSVTQTGGVRGSRRKRRVDLASRLDGSYRPPTPEVGGERDDNRRILYAGKWHTVIGLTGCGKSWFATWHAVETIRRGGTVVYLHFEESSPDGTLSRLKALGMPNDQIADGLIWLDNDTRWALGELGEEIAELDRAPELVILDGINAACSRHGWDPMLPKAVGEYREMFVAPSAITGAGVLSLGHPPKARDRQGERHGFGSTAWLDEVDGAGLRLIASKKSPIRRGSIGSSSLYVVKDRYGEIERHGQYQDSGEGGWYYFGNFVIDDGPDGRNTTARLGTPKMNEDGQTRDVIDGVCDEIVRCLLSRDGEFASAKNLMDMLRSDGVKVFDANIKPSIDRLSRRGVIEITRGARGAVGGRLVEAPGQGAAEEMGS